MLHIYIYIFTKHGYISSLEHFGQGIDWRQYGF